MPSSMATTRTVFIILPYIFRSQIMNNHVNIGTRGIEDIKAILLESVVLVQ
jgi:hypothetical protein